jgi:hypothetical protein
MLNVHFGGYPAVRSFYAKDKSWPEVAYPKPRIRGVFYVCGTATIGRKCSFRNQ